ANRDLSRNVGGNVGGQRRPLCKWLSNAYSSCFIVNGIADQATPARTITIFRGSNLSTTVPIVKEQRELFQNHFAVAHRLWHGGCAI
ncbi:MAG TPA: hypothetical protein VJ723_07775, partial [Candidatus Angelobacter sp.]|nr:hypothetical protein [Candidatus Angelobacter sp.]